MNSNLFYNNLSTTLAADLTDVATTAELTDASGITPTDLVVPQATNTGNAAEIFDKGRYVSVTLVPPEGATSLADLEVVWIRQLTTNTATIVRAQEGTTAKAWPAGTLVQGRLTAGMADRFFRPDINLIEMSRVAHAYPAAGISTATYECGFDDMVNISPNGNPAYGDGAVNIGFGIDSGADSSASTSFAPNRFAVNVGAGGVFDNGDNTGIGEAVCIGAGGAFGEMAMNFGGGGAGSFSTNFGNGGAFPGATTEAEGSFNWGDVGSYSPGSINLGNGGGGPGSAGGITIGRNSSGAGGGGVAIGLNANNVTFNACVALGSDSANTAANQVHVGDRDLELGSAASSRGVHVYSPNGTRYRITVDDTGTVIATATPI